jgi:hypothetical protein
MAFGSQNLSKNLTSGKKKTPQTVKIDLPGAKPTGDGTMAPPKVKKISTTEKPVNPNPSAVVPAGTGVGGVGTVPSNQQASLMSAASVPPPASSPLGGGRFAPRPARNEEASNDTAHVYDPMNGFAARYDPTQVGGLYDDPNLILEDVLAAQGLPVSNARIAGMGDYASRMGALSGLLSLTQQGSGAAGSDERWINTVAELLNNSMGQGGSQIGYQQALQLLLDQSPTDALSGYLYGDADDNQFGLNDQASALQPLFMAAITGVNPYMQQAMASAYRGATNAAQGGLSRGTDADPRIAQYLRTKLGGIVPGL